MKQSIFDMFVTRSTCSQRPECPEGAEVPEGDVLDQCPMMCRTCWLLCAQRRALNGTRWRGLKSISTPQWASNGGGARGLCQCRSNQEAQDKRRCAKCRYYHGLAWILAPDVSQYVLQYGGSTREIGPDPVPVSG